jgi:hypothetical protein
MTHAFIVIVIEVLGFENVLQNYVTIPNVLNIGVLWHILMYRSSILIIIKLYAVITNFVKQERKKTLLLLN